MINKLIIILSITLLTGCADIEKRLNDERFECANGWRVRHSYLCYLEK